VLRTIGRSVTPSSSSTPRCGVSRSRTSEPSV
jgi:hypothetical protein